MPDVAATPPGALGEEEEAKTGGCGRRWGFTSSDPRTVPPEQERPKRLIKFGFHSSGSSPTPEAALVPLQNIPS